ncbi:MAG: hypothetical protein NVSMB39_2740 [Candidatus Saccharimonadales bacterium]
MQTDTNPEAAKLLTAFSLIPALVTFDKDVPVAEEVISSVSRILGAGPASRPAVHPRPSSAGVCWSDLDVDAQIKYDAVVDLLALESPHVQLEQDSLKKALQMVKDGMKQLADLPQQGYSGMVQRNS